MTEPSKRRHPNEVNVSEVEPREFHQGRIGNRAWRLGAAAGSAALGCSVTELAPGDTSYPYHFHSSLEEALFVLEGEGTLRIGAEQVALRSGDYAAFPVGPELAHTLTNGGSVPLRYLVLSSPCTPVTMDVIGYPDSNKVAFSSGVTGPGKSWFRKMIKQDQASLDYFEDEPLASE